MPGPLFPIQNFVAKPYSGVIRGINVSLLSRGGVTTNDGQTIQQGSASKIVNIQVDFLTATYKGQAVSVNLQSSANAAPLSKILMMYVDNELNSQNVTIAFPDTQQYIGVPAFTTGYYPVLTGQLQAVIYNGSTGKVPVTAQSQVSVIFCDFAIPGFLSQETLSVTFNSSSGPVVPVIGDTVQTNTLSTSTTNPDILLPTVVQPIQYVVTGIEVNANNLFLTPSRFTTPPNNWTLWLYLYDPTQVHGNSLTRLFSIDMRCEYNGTSYQLIANETGLNIPVQSLVALLAQDDFGTPIGGTKNLGTQTGINVSITYAKVTL